MSLKFIYIENKSKTVGEYIDLCNFCKQSGSFLFQSDVESVANEYFQKFEDKITTEQFQITYEMNDGKIIIELSSKGAIKSVTNFLQDNNIPHKISK